MFLFLFVVAINRKTVIAVIFQNRPVSCQIGTKTTSPSKKNVKIEKKATGLKGVENDATKYIFGRWVPRPKVDRFVPFGYSVDYLCQFASKSVHLFSKYSVHKFGNRRTDGRTYGQPENIMPSTVILACRRHKICLQSRQAWVNFGDSNYSLRIICHYELCRTAYTFQFGERARAFAYAGPAAWNRLPERIRHQSPAPATPRRQLKTCWFAEVSNATWTLNNCTVCWSICKWTQTYDDDDDAIQHLKQRMMSEGGGLLCLTHLFLSTTAVSTERGDQADHADMHCDRCLFSYLRSTLTYLLTYLLTYMSALTYRTSSQGVAPAARYFTSI